jgi:hypothetical protein
MDDDRQDAVSHFLFHLGQELQGMPEVDHDLARVLSDLILKELPADDCVLQAETAIMKLAAKRASDHTESEIG